MSFVTLVMLNTPAKCIYISTKSYSNCYYVDTSAIKCILLPHMRNKCVYRDM